MKLCTELIRSECALEYARRNSCRLKLSTPDTGCSRSETVITMRGCTKNPVGTGIREEDRRMCVGRLSWVIHGAFIGAF
jgi:hypothetical protein